MNLLIHQERSMSKHGIVSSFIVLSGIVMNRIHQYIIQLWHVEIIERACFQGTHSPERIKTKYDSGKYRI